jgi:hypothetical protein
MTSFLRVKIVIESSSFLSYFTRVRRFTIFSPLTTHMLVWRINISNKRKRERNIHSIVIRYIFFYFRSDLIGCMSFNMKTLLKTTSCTKVRKSIKFMCEKDEFYLFDVINSIKNNIRCKMTNCFFFFCIRLHQNINGIVYYHNQLDDINVWL